MTVNAIAMDTLTIRHQDQDLPYQLRNGGYTLKGGTITLSVDCVASGEGDVFPPSAMLCLDRFPLVGRPKVGDVYASRGGMLVNTDEVDTRVWGYFTFHVDQITLAWTVEAVEGDTMIVGLEASHDDVNYHGEQARETTTRGRFRLHRKPLDSLWVPE